MVGAQELTCRRKPITLHKIALLPRRAGAAYAAPGAEADKR